MDASPGARSSSPGSQKVWDAPTRLFHWLLAGLVAFSWWTAEEHIMDWHKASGLTMVTNPVTFKIGDNEAKVTYAGLAPTFIGLYQFNVEVPANTASGDHALTVIQGGEPIAQKLTITVKAAQ